MRTVKHFVTYLVVAGSDEFATDMLRYDNCVPMEERDSSAIREVTHHPRAVFLRRYSREEALAPATEERWRSLGWVVLDQFAFKPDASTIESYRRDVVRLIEKRSAIERVSGQRRASAK